MRIYITRQELVTSERVKTNERKITTVLFGNGTGKFRNFRCINCGVILFQYSGKEVTDIIDASQEASENSDSIDVMCRMCHEVFRVIG